MSQILVDRRDRVAVLTVHDPDRRNALNLTLAAELAEAVRACEADKQVGAVVVTGTPPAFCAGADLTALGEAREKGLRDIYAGFLAVANCSLPTVAAVNGAAVGAGLNLALACDVRLAGDSARFDARFLQLGIHPGGGMTWMLQRIVGPQQAAAMTLFSQVYDAKAALAAGLVLDVVDDVVERAVQVAGQAAQAPRELVVATKRTMRATATTTAHADAVELEIVPQLASMDSPAFAERLAALRRRISGN
ncbi:enoyl-CoA hydratase [Kutzneria sp. CA-103260]|uniref:enoyl-CoA hydratase n=1 Tax=Kutzneria sp. CA-103260 TaxID=2802641 RepID=UPI001BA869ED|nr:enoyl-CoA hydratase [Kutzneria sp. CA-103260]QUQ70557.1 enoyl-CoA hydratase [Kutzneria sp. CA-103260]